MANMSDTLQGYRLSPQQKYLWQLGDGAITGSSDHSHCLPYRAQCIIRIGGDLDRDRLQQAVERVVERHEILRTYFQSPENSTLGVQVVADKGIAWQPSCDLTSDNATVGAQTLERLFQQDSQTPWDLERDAPLRLTLVKLDANDWALLVSLPAFCADRYTLTQFVRELAECYAQNRVLEEEPLQYADLATWQNELLESPETEAGRAYWQQQNGHQQQAALPLERPKSWEQPFQPQTHRLQLDSDRIVAAETLCHQLLDRDREQPPMALWEWLLASAQVWLGRFDGFWKATSCSRSVAVTFDGRKYRELETAFGPLAKGLPLDTTLQGHQKLADIVYNNRTAIDQAHRFQEYFSPETIGLMSSDRPFFPIGFEFATLPPPIDAGNVSFAIDRLHAYTGRFTLLVQCTHRHDGLEIAFHYDSNALDAETIRYFAASFVALLDSSLAHPKAAIETWDILNREQKEQLLVTFNQVRLDVPTEDITRQWEKQVRQTPDRVVVVCQGQQPTYRQVNARANQIARYLQQKQVASDVLVGLCVGRSPDAIAALLGILKAGGAYVPLDPSLPSDSIAQRFEDASVSIVVVQQEFLEKLPATNAEVVCLDEEAIATQSDRDLGISIPPSSLAYVLFTSGSTGRAKGVAVERRQLWNYLHAARERMQLPQQANYASVSTLAADLGHTILFPPLLWGGCLHLIDYECATDRAAWAQYCQKHAIDCLKIVPSHLESLLATDDPQQVLPRQCLILGGEAARWELLDRVRHYARHCAIFNHYGPTETTVGATAFLADCDFRWRANTETVPLGQPLANVQVYVLDDSQQPVPVGVKGEIYIGGEGVARGYVNLPEKTAECFLPHPFASGSRLYRTGDLGRYLPDGTLEFLGRRDRQVKLRGFRIELEEIEAVFQSHPSIRQAVALVSEGQNLVVYLVPADGESGDSQQMRAWARQKLPEHMVPSALVFLDELPLTSNGKVDTGALPKPDQATSQVAPRTPVEEVLAGIWMDVLELDRVGVGDNFFDLGGHSLLVTQVASRIRNAFSIEFPMRRLFEFPTIADLGSVIEAQLRAGDATQQHPIPTISREGELPLSFAQQRIWFFDRLAPEAPIYNVFAAVRLQGPLDAVALKQSWNELANRHEVLRTTFVERQGAPVQQIAERIEIDMPTVDLQALTPQQQEQEVRRLAVADAQCPFQLERGPLLRTTLLRLNQQESILLFAVHHIVADGWSQAPIVRELAALYEAFCQGKPSPLPELPIQYADFAVWQRQWLQGQVLQDLLAYWHRQLADLPALSFPSDRPRPAVQKFRGARLDHQLSQDLSQRLQALSRHEGVTLFMTLLAAFKVLLRWYARQDDIVVGTNVANRNRTEIEGLIGFFTNQLVLRTDLSGTPTFRELLGRVRQVALDAYAHQDLPFDKLVESLNPQRHLGSQPLFQVKFVLENAPMPPLEMSELKLDVLDIDRGIATLDLFLRMVHTEKGLVACLEYDRDLFDRATIEQVLNDLETLFQEISDRPEVPLTELEETLNSNQRERQKNERQKRRSMHKGKLKQIRRYQFSVPSE